MHRRADPAGPQEAARVPGLRHALHARAPARARPWSRPRAPAPPTTGTRGSRERAAGPAAVEFAGLQCPIPLSEYPHGHAGPRRRRAADAHADRAHVPRRLPQPRAASRCTTARVLDAARAGRLAFTTDSFVVSPLFFPGGDIGSLAVHGTVNDLAMCGARPLALSARLHPRRGPADGRAVAHRDARWRERRAQAGVPIVTGDTKVVDRGKGDGIFINTTGIGVVARGRRHRPAPRAARRRGAAQRAHRRPRHRDHVGARGARVRDRRIESDSRRAQRPRRRAARRGGRPACTCCATRRAAGWPARSTRSPSRRSVGHPARRDAPSRWPTQVRGACEILGLDPLYVANEGKFLAIVAPRRPSAALAALRAHPLGREAAIIGEVVAEHPGACAHAQPHRRHAHRGHAERGAAAAHLLRRGASWASSSTSSASRCTTGPASARPSSSRAARSPAPGATTPRASRRARRSWSRRVAACAAAPADRLPASRRLAVGARGPGARRPQGRGRAEAPGGDRGGRGGEGQHPRPQPPPGPGLPWDAPGCAAAAPQVSLDEHPRAGARHGPLACRLSVEELLTPSRRRRTRSRPAAPVAPVSEAPATASPPALLRDPWALATLLAIVPLALRMLGAPLAEPVAEDFDFHRALLQGFGSVFDGGGSLAFWRPIPHQLYYTVLGPLLVTRPAAVGVLHLALLALGALLLYRALRPHGAAPSRRRPPRSRCSPSPRGRLPARPPSSWTSVCSCSWRWRSTRPHAGGCRAHSRPCSRPCCARRSVVAAIMMPLWPAGLRGRGERCAGRWPRAR